MAGDYWKMVSNQLVGWTIWWWILEETDGICSMRGLNHVIDNEGDWWWLAKWEGWTLWWWIMKETNGICSVRGPSHWLDTRVQLTRQKCFMFNGHKILCISFTELGNVVLYLGVYVVGKNTPKSKISRVK